MKSDGVLEVMLCSSLEKIFPDEKPEVQVLSSSTMLMNEVFSFQAVYTWSGSLLDDAEISVVSRLGDAVSVRKTGLVPAQMPCYKEKDGYELRTSPGLFPDPLLPFDENRIVLLPDQWRSIWVTIKPEGRFAKGIYPVSLSFLSKKHGKLGSAVFSIEILPHMLPEQTIKHTEWFHADCIASHYGVEIFSEKHWELIDKYMHTAADNGINMLLTPLFTPPLDTAVGGERPTVQLVDVIRSADSYSFGFDKLKRWIRLCDKNKITFLEFSHLFTQWGARHAPKITAKDNGVIKRIFGWETDVRGAAYRNFLSQFLLHLRSFIEENHLEKRCLFHVSDEPHLDDLEAYIYASSILKEYLPGYPVIDALSNYEFYSSGAVKTPIPAADHIDPFIENQIPDLWTYYCCGQYKEVPNRFLCMPSSKNRIIGFLFFKYDIKGFLHWGYNFWYSRNSHHPVDPFCSTDGDCGFPAGDPFVVYPGKEGPIESLRLKVFNEALQDLRACSLLASYIGKEKVMDIIEEDLDNELKFSCYPKDPDWIIAKREKINQLIADICR
jgi:hypothetical protein